jgi:hypothetical protein
VNWRPVVVGALSLIALQVFVSGKGPDASGQLLGWLATALDKAMSPKVAALPYRGRKPASAPAPKPPANDDWRTGPIGLPTNPSVTPV